MSQLASTTEVVNHICTQGGGGEGRIKVYPPSKIFAKLVNKNAIKHQKVVPSPKNFHNPYIPSLAKFGKNLPDPPHGFSNRVHLCSQPMLVDANWWQPMLQSGPKSSGKTRSTLWSTHRLNIGHHQMTWLQSNSSATIFFNGYNWL